MHYLYTCRLFTKRFVTSLYSPSISFIILTAITSCLPFVLCIHLYNVLQLRARLSVLHVAFTVHSVHAIPLPCMPAPSTSHTPLSLFPTPLLTLTLPRSQGMRQPQNPVFSAYILKESTYLPPTPAHRPPNPRPTHHCTQPSPPPHFSLLPLPPLLSLLPHP